MTRAPVIIGACRRAARRCAGRERCQHAVLAELQQLTVTERAARGANRSALGVGPDPYQNRALTIPKVKDSLAAATGSLFTASLPAILTAPLNGEALDATVEQVLDQALFDGVAAARDWLSSAASAAGARAARTMRRSSCAPWLCRTEERRGLLARRAAAYGLSAYTPPAASFVFSATTCICGTMARALWK